MSRWRSRAIIRQSGARFEHDAQPEAFSSVFASMWWAAVTFTTVGYGDVYPITIGGRIFTVIMLLVALGIIAVPTGIVASALSQIRRPKGGRIEGRSWRHGRRGLSRIASVLSRSAFSLMKPAASFWS